MVKHFILQEIHNDDQLWIEVWLIVINTNYWIRDNWQHIACVAYTISVALFRFMVWFSNTFSHFINYVTNKFHRQNKANLYVNVIARLNFEEIGINLHDQFGSRCVMIWTPKKVIGNTIYDLNPVINIFQVFTS